MLLKNITQKDFQKRQVIDIKFITTTTEHRAQTGECACGITHTAKFPHFVSAYVQYAERVRSLVSYFSQYQLIPFDRLREIFQDVFKIPLCEGTVQNTNMKGHDKLNYFEEEIKELLKLSETLHVDENPVKVNKSRHYVHVVIFNPT